MPVSQYAGFSGSAADLVEIALTCGAAYKLNLDQDKTNERLIRYYVAEGVLDRPERVGRDAAYAYRHLVQLLAARRMVDAGMALATVARHNQAATTKVLEEGLNKPLPTAAEILVAQFMDAGSGKQAQVAPHADASRLSGRPSPPGFASPRTSMALPDVLDEVRQIRSELLDRVSGLDSQLARSGADQAAAMHRLQHMLEDVIRRQAGIEQAIAALGQRVDEVHRGQIDGLVDPDIGNQGIAKKRPQLGKTK